MLFRSEYALESVIDEMEERLEIDPMELRLKNAAKEGDRQIFGQQHAVIGNEAVMLAAQQSAHYRSELSGRYQGRGVAMGFWGNAGLESAAYAAVQPDGRVTLTTGSVDIGGGRATLAMQLAETLGINYEDVTARVGDTDSIGFTHVTGGSRTTFATGWAVFDAAHDIMSQLEERAALIWEVDRGQVKYQDGGEIGRAHV